MLSLALVVIALPITAAATETDDAVIYDASEISPFKDRTLQDVADHYSAARYAGETYIDSDSSTWYSTPSSTSAPYAAGVLTEDTHEAMTAMTNFYRWLVGVPELTATSQHSDSLQAQALDRNFEFDHFISNSSKPEDMDEDLWNEGFACDHNILARWYTPQGAITGWINEGYSTYYQEWDTLGHRYALIGSDCSDVQFGYSGSIAIGKNVSSQNTMETPFAAFPAPGYMPTSLVSPSSSAWSVELNNAAVTVEDSSAVVITITNLSTGEAYQRTEADGTAQVSNWTISFVQPPADERYSGEYTVEITGLTDAVTGKAAVIRYTTNFIDITETAASYITEAAGDISQYVIYQSMADSLEKVAAILPDEITVTSEIGGSATIPVSGAWTVDESNNCFVNSADANLLPSHMTDKNGLLEKIMIPYTISDDWYDSFNTLSIRPDTVSLGDTVTFRVYRTLVSTDSSQIFKLTENEDGTYSAVKKFDSSTSSDFDKELSDENEPYHIYNHTAVAEDNGEYISVYFDSTDVDWGGISFYVSTDTKTLTVACNHIYGDPVIENRKDATCTENGSYDSVVYCTACGEELSRTTITVDKTDHTTSEAVRENEKAATCTKAGSYDSVVYCSVCGKELSREMVEIPMTEHEYISHVTEPTCTEKGYTTYTCSQCNDSYTDNYTDALGHDYVMTITKNPTADESGEMKYTCSRCNDSYTEVIPALGHTWDKGVVTKEATCTETGIKTYTCTDPGCKKTYTEVIAALGHTAGEPVRENETAATCTKTGAYDSVVYCTVCGEELQRTTEIIDRIDHTASEAVRENEETATCTKAGSYDSVVYCSVCGRELSRETVEVPVLEHEYKSSVTKPTCTEKGYTTYICSHCGDSYTDNYTDALGHTYVDGVCTLCGTKEPVEHVHSYGDPVFTWNEDHSAANAAFTCIDGDDKQIIECVITSEITSEGNTVYTATVEFNNETYSNTQIVAAPNTPEVPNEPEVPAVPGVPEVPVKPDTPTDSDSSNKPGSVTDSNKPSTNVTTPDNSNSSAVKTGDSQNPVIWGTLMVMSIVGLVIVLFKKKRYSK
ncbi:hypothetical protein B5F07_02600 [Lachnoclostridium sp. An169]|nr:hypothetical protein B5F07_02600 [Lachnoclostridium sp. An169]